MDAVYIPLISALVGALIGSISSVAAIYIQSRITDRRERLRIVADLAVQDWKAQLDVARASGRAVPPLVLTFVYYWDLVAAAGKDDLTPELLRAITDRNDRVFDMILEVDRARRAPRQSG